MIKCEHCWDTGYYKGYGAPCGECPKDRVISAKKFKFTEIALVKRAPKSTGFGRIIVEDPHLVEPQYEVGMRVRFNVKGSSDSQTGVIENVHEPLYEGDCRLYIKDTGGQAYWGINLDSWDIEICSN